MRAFRSTVVLAAVLAAFAAARAGANPPPAFQKPGEWHYQSETRYDAGPMSHGDVHNQWSVCVTDAAAQTPPSGMPHAAGVKCDKPTLQVTKGSYHTGMTCTAHSANGADSLIKTDFTFTPSPDRTSMVMDGTVHQTITGLPVTIPPAVMHMHITGTRVGACAAAGKAP